MARTAVPAAIRSAACAPLLCSIVLAVIVSPASAQVRDRDARIPRSGELWVEAAPQFKSWHEQFAQGSEAVADGHREPLYVNYDEDVAGRLFPGLDPLLLVLNRDAPALGFTPLTANDVYLGNLEFSTIDVFERRIPLGLQYGIGGFAAIEVMIPIVQTELETSFVFDSASATVVRAEAALSDPAAFFSGLDAAQSQLQAALDGGGLSAEDSLLAAQLLEDTEAFQGALTARIGSQEYLFTAGSAAGQQINAYWAGFEAGYQTFGIALPAFALPTEARRADFDAYLTREPLLGQPLQNVTRGYTLGPIEIGARFKLIDTFGWPTRPPPPPPADTGRVRRSGPEPAPDSLAAADSVIVPARRTVPALDSLPPVAPDSVAVVAPDSLAVVAPDSLAAPDGVAEPGSLRPSEVPVVPDTLAPSVHPPGMRFRTTVGARYRFASDADQDPYLIPGIFLQQPIGDGAADLQIEIYQDISFGSTLWLVAGATYGIQLGDELERRVAPPDRPFALASQEVTVHRDLGNYLRIVVSPRLALTEAMSLALEYTFWKKGADTYEAVAGGLDASPLAMRTTEKRHRIGVGAYYRTTRLFAAGRSGIPIDLAFLWETSIAGSGGLTPASSVVTASARVPLELF